MNKNENIQPDFKKLDDPETFMDHIEKLTAPKEAVAAKKILATLLEQIEPIDFEGRVFSRPKYFFDGQGVDEFDDEDSNDKLRDYHYQIETIEYLKELTEKNDWGLAKYEGLTYVYNGAFWSSVPKDTLKNFLGDAAEKMGVPKYKAMYFRFRDNLLLQFYASTHLEVPEKSYETVKINLLNGTYEITSTDRGIRQFDRNDFLRYQLPFKYDERAKSPIFHKYLEEVLPDEDDRKTMAEFLGYVFISSRTLKLEKTLILYGPGANGKSVFFEVVNAMLGKDNITNYPLQSLTDDKGYQRAKLGGSLLNYASEISVKMADNAIFKQLVSGEPVDARLPFKDPFMLTDYGKLAFNCNRLPRNTEQTDAFFRRFHIVHFNVTIPEERQDKELHKKIIDKELSGVFNWMLEGLDRLIERKAFTESKTSKRILSEYRRASDSVLMFVEECCQVSTEYYTTIKDIYLHYKSYCIENGYTCVGNSAFRERIERVEKVSIWQERKVYVTNLVYPGGLSEKRINI